MLRSLLLGLDGTAHSEAALEVGISWAKRFECLLVGLGIVDEPTIRGLGHTAPSSPSSQKVFDQIVGDAARKVEQFLERFTLRCSAEQVSHKVLEDVRLPSEAILLESQRYDLILLGQETHFHFETQERPCATLEKVLRSAARPVVAAPREPPAAGTGGGVLIGYDGSVQAARALYAFACTGLHQLGPVHVLCLHPDSAVEAAKTADRAIEFLRFHDIPAERIGVVGPSRPGETLLEKSRELGVDLLVMGAYGRSRLAEFFLGSSTHTVIQNSPVPVFLFH